MRPRLELKMTAYVRLRLRRAYLPSAHRFHFAPEVAHEIKEMRAHRKNFPGVTTGDRFDAADHAIIQQPFRLQINGLATAGMIDREDDPYRAAGLNHGNPLLNRRGQGFFAEDRLDAGSGTVQDHGKVQLRRRADT